MTYRPETASPKGLAITFDAFSPVDVEGLAAGTLSGTAMTGCWREGVWCWHEGVGSGHAVTVIMLSLSLLGDCGGAGDDGIESIPLPSTMLSSLEMYLGFFL